MSSSEGLVRPAPTPPKLSGVQLEGGLLGPDLLERLASGDLPGQRPKDFGLSPDRSLLDEIAEVYREARDRWRIFRRRLERLPADDGATSLTREGWVLPFLGLLGYELHYNRTDYEVGGVRYAISHRAGPREDAPPVHIVGVRRELGRVDPNARPRLSPHALLQEFLNRSGHLWGLVTNGRTLRLLRDSTYVRRQAYVEFDLELILEAEADARFGDFVVLYRLLHRSRLPQGIEDAPQCWLEVYHKQAVEQGERARNRLRDSVEKSLKLLGTGFLQANGTDDNPWNPDPSELYEQLLRLVYRILFLLVAEERGLLEGTDLYRQHYSVSRLRRLLDHRGAYTDHQDLWHSLRLLFYLLRDPSPHAQGQPLASLLGLSVLNGGLFEPIALEERTLLNRHLLQAFYHLVYVWDEEANIYRRVNYAALDVEELGSVYESLLDHQPLIQNRTFEFAAGMERKSTGSYYTPPELVTELLRSALEPVLAERKAAAQQANTEMQRVAHREWRVVQEKIKQLFGEEYADSIISRLGSLAKSHGIGARNLSHHEGLSERRTLRPDQPDASSGHLGSGEHRRGLGTAGDEGISAIPEYRLGQPAGAGNLPPSGRADWAPQSGARASSSSEGGNPKQADGDPPAQSQTEVAPSVPDLPTLWGSLSLATRQSLLAKALAEHAVLSLRVLDPACGSGHFLLAAARTLGKELAKIRTQAEEPAPEEVRQAVREVIAQCLYGVDKNPLAVELCQVALWIESHVPGKPLTFLDHRIRCGDSLVGVVSTSACSARHPRRGVRSRQHGRKGGRGPSQEAQPQRAQRSGERAAAPVVCSRARRGRFGREPPRHRGDRRRLPAAVRGSSAATAACWPTLTDSASPKPATSGPPRSSSAIRPSWPHRQPRSPRTR